MDAFSITVSGRTSVSAVLKALQILQDGASDPDAVSFKFEADQMDECTPVNPLDCLEAMHRAILSECEFGEDGKWHYYGKEKRK